MGVELLKAEVFRKSGKKSKPILVKKFFTNSPKVCEMMENKLNIVGSEITYRVKLPDLDNTINEGRYVVR